MNKTTLKWIATGVAVLATAAATLLHLTGNGNNADASSGNDTQAGVQQPQTPAAPAPANVAE